MSEKKQNELQLVFCFLLSAVAMHIAESVGRGLPVAVIADRRDVCSVTMLTF